MPRNITPAIDIIRENSLLIKEYITNGGAYLGTQKRAKLNGLRARLRHLRESAYNLMIGGHDDGTGGRTYIILKDAEIDYEAAPDSPNGERMVRVYWRPDQVMAARAREGLAVRELKDWEQEALNEARSWLLAHL